MPEGQPQESLDGYVEVKLTRGYRKDKKIYDKVLMREVKGKDQIVMMQNENASNLAIQTSILISRIVSNLICSKDSSKIRMTREVADDMSNANRNTIVLKAAELDQGPSLKMNVTCPKCNLAFEAGVTIQSFFTQGQAG